MRLITGGNRISQMAVLRLDDAVCGFAMQCQITWST